MLIKQLAVTVSGLALTVGTAAYAQETGAQGSVAAEGAQQTTPETESAETDEIIVTGIRASLEGAQQIKRNATAVVDSIVAEDIGKLPDNTVSDALQRVTGVQVSRGGGEANTVLIRGLPNIQTFINGREAFTGTGRFVVLQDIPAELVAGLDVYKTNTPELIEGGVAGRIDIRLRRPLDFPDFTIAGSARGIYSDQADKWSYIGSGLVSGRWTTESGQEFGILVGGSFNKRKYEDQTAFNFGWNPDGRAINPATGNAIIIPDTVGAIYNVGDRERPAGNIALQWKPNPDLEFFVDGIYTGYREKFDVNFFIGIPKFLQGGGTITATVQPGSDFAATATSTNNTTITSKQAFSRKTDGYQVNGGGRWTTGKAVLSSEFTYSESTVNSQQLVLDTGFDAPRVDYAFNNNGTPSINLNGFPITDPNAVNLFTLFDNRNRDTTKQYAVRADLLYSPDNGGFIENFKIGARYARRTGTSGGTDPSGIGGIFGPAEALFPGLIGLSPSNILDGAVGIDRFVLANSDALRERIGALRTRAGRPAGDPPFDPARTFSLTEDVYAFYGQSAFRFDVGSMPVDGTLGVRVVNTVTDLNAIVVTQPPGSPPPPRINTPINSNSNLLDILPSISIRARPADNIVLRFVAGESITRPEFAQLNPATGLTELGVTGGAIGSGAGGNPDLRSIQSKNLDLTAEWYFSNTGSITVAGFYRDLKGYIQSFGALEQFVNSAGNVSDFIITRPRNTESGELKGAEIAVQTFFDFLPGALSGFGVQANFTYTDGSVQAAPIPGQPLAQQEIVQVSKYAYNLVGLYEKYGLSARVAYNWRSKFIDSYSAVVPGGRIIVEPLGFMDASISYDLTPQFTITVDATNILDTRYRDNFGDSGFTPRDTRQFDRTISAGVRFRF